MFCLVPSAHACTQSAIVCVRGCHTDLVIEVGEDNVRFLSLKPETSMLGIQYDTG